MAHHYRMTDHENRSITTRRQLSASPGRTWKNSKWDLHQERPLGILSLSNGLEKHIEKQVRSEETPHIGHADSVMNDEHESRSDISDWSSPNPVTRVIKVTLPTPTISLYNHPYIHTRIHSIRPCPLDDLGPESPGGSGTKASHVQRNASQRSVLCHEAVVCLIRHEQPTEPGEKIADEPRAALAQSTPKQTGLSQPSRSILNLSPSP